MGVTVANLAPGEDFVLADGLPEEEFAPLPVRERLPFCSFCDAEISPPQCRNGRVSFTLHLSSCKVRLVFEGAENFVRDADFVRVKRGKTLQFLDCSIQKCGNAYVYSLTAAGDLAELARRTAEHLTGRWYACGGAAALTYSDLLSLSEYCKTPQGRREKSRERSYGREFVRALCRAAQEM